MPSYVQGDDTKAPGTPGAAQTVQTDDPSAPNYSQDQKAKEDAANAAAQQAAQQAQIDALNNHYNYGGYAGGASQAADYYQRTAAADANRPGVAIDYNNANGSRQNALGDRQNNLNDRQMQLQGAGQQSQMAGLLRARAMGQMPSISQMQADRQMQQATAQQSSAMASARGPAGLALAQQGAAANTANAASNISNMAQVNGAQEQLNNTLGANQAYAGLQQTYGGIRSGDAQAQGLDYQGQGQDAQQAQAQAQQDAQQRALNDQAFQNNSQNSIGINNSQLQAQGNQVAVQYGQQQAQAQLAQQADFQGQNRTDKYIGYGLGAAGTLAGVGALALFGGGGSGGPPPNTGGGGSNVSNPSGGGGDSGYGQPGSTPGGFDAQTGAPVAGGGGGYDPNVQRQNITGPVNIAPSTTAPHLTPQASTSAMHPNYYSDVSAKRDVVPMDGLMPKGDPRAQAWDEGRAAALADMRKLASKSPEELKTYGDNDLAKAVRQLKGDAWDEGRAGVQAQPGAGSGDAKLAAIAAQQGGATPADRGGLSAASDPNTAQFASGLAPSFYQYKDGIGSPGQKFGPMAQDMASQPATATAIRQDPRNGLLSIDPADGLKVALGGVGHLAQKQTVHDQEIALLKKRAGLLQASAFGQGQGLVDTGSSLSPQLPPQPSLGAQYLQYVRGQ